jgi:hypothetical protein
MITAAWNSYWLFSQTFEGVVYFWPVSLLLIANAGVAMFYSTLTTRLLVLLVPFIWPVLILLVAAAWWDGIGVSEVPIVGVAALFCIQIILSIGITYELRGRRWAATSVCLVALWLGALSWFVAGMALSNVWL